MRAIIFGLVFISPPFLKKMLLKWFCGAKFGRGAQIGWFSAVVGRDIRMGERSVIRPFTLISLNGEIRLGAYSEISSFCLVYGSSSLSLGEGSYIGPQSLINIEEPVVIGNGSAIGGRGMVFTHGSFLPYTEGYFIKLDGVTLGDNVWCAAGVFIAPGVEIGENTFVNSGSVVTQSIPSGSVAEGNPAKVIYPMNRLKREMTIRHVDLALQSVLHEYARIVLKGEYRLKLVKEEKDQLLFQYKKRNYRICIIPSKIELGEQVSVMEAYRQIFIVNCPTWQPPQKSFVFDMLTMQTAFGKDPIQESLRIFMLRYFGIRFRDRRIEGSTDRTFGG